MDLRNLEMEEYCPPPDLLDLLEELKIPHHLDKLKELGYDDVDDFENVDITRFETAKRTVGVPVETTANSLAAAAAAAETTAAQREVLATR
ncbi:hypothetical protein T492DRAFT_873981 [Pavlovales sp. CCMP2436]|nr:hypothetical protein T492DRAFT_873981 [Pavlovales sp. CCMP2436]